MSKYFTFSLFVGCQQCCPSAIFPESAARSRQDSVASSAKKIRAMEKKFGPKPIPQKSALSSRIVACLASHHFDEKSRSIIHCFKHILFTIVKYLLPDFG